MIPFQQITITPTSSSRAERRAVLAWSAPLLPLPSSLCLWAWGSARPPHMAAAAWGWAPPAGRQPLVLPTCPAAADSAVQHPPRPSRTLCPPPAACLPPGLRLRLAGCMRLQSPARQPGQRPARPPAAAARGYQMRCSCRWGWGGDTGVMAMKVQALVAAKRNLQNRASACCIFPRVPLPLPPPVAALKPALLKSCRRRARAPGAQLLPRVPAAAKRGMHVIKLVLHWLLPEQAACVR